MSEHKTLDEIACAVINAQSTIKTAATALQNEDRGVVFEATGSIRLAADCL